MKIPTTLISAARVATAAVALVLMIATTAAQSALADDSGLPPAPTTPSRPSVRNPQPDPAVLSNGGNVHDSAGHRRLWFRVQNVGLAPSKSISVYGSCTYMIQVGAFQESVVEMPGPVTMLPPLSPGATHEHQEIDCAPMYGRTAVAVRVQIASDGDKDTSNNTLRSPK